MSAVLLVAATMLRLGLPHINVLSKVIDKRHIECETKCEKKLQQKGETSINYPIDLFFNLLTD